MRLLLEGCLFFCFPLCTFWAVSAGDDRCVLRDSLGLTQEQLTPTAPRRLLRFVHPQTRARRWESPSDSPGLTLERLTLAPPGGGRPLTQRLDLALEHGQSLLVVGPSGCGKSSLLRSIAGA